MRLAFCVATVLAAGLHAVAAAAGLKSGKTGQIKGSCWWERFWL